MDVRSGVPALPPAAITIRNRESGTTESPTDSQLPQTVRRLKLPFLVLKQIQNHHKIGIKRIKEAGELETFPAADNQ
jgi:hypothetical protein